ncbi:MAG: 1-pyrroline-5-carboxylate dehydrogenase, partial [Verrucomicrobia bacterium]
GKNAIVITAQADRELAIKDLVKSAFGHAGQKCSAASLAIVESEVYHDPIFRRQLRDAAASLAVGPSTALYNVVTPLIRPPSPALLRALTTLEKGEEWLLEPKQDPQDPCLWSPGIKLGVQPNSWFHQQECFGPVLGIMCATSLEEAICWQNATAYGLTAGLHSLDPIEQKRWMNQVEAGNLYINRPITGAIVRRQPFGGWKRSSIGAGIKAGGPHYVRSFSRFSDSEQVPFSIVSARYSEAWKRTFSAEHDPSNLRCESNILRYRPRRGVILRLAKKDSQILERAQLASQLTHTPLLVSIAADESDREFIKRLGELCLHSDTLRTVKPPSDTVLQAAYEHNLNWIDAPITADGYSELCFWLREQVISQTLHRYGQIPAWIPKSRQKRSTP